MIGKKTNKHLLILCVVTTAHIQLLMGSGAPEGSESSPDLFKQAAELKQRVQARKPKPTANPNQLGSPSTPLLQKFAQVKAALERREPVAAQHLPKDLSKNDADALVAELNAKGQLRDAIVSGNAAAIVEATNGLPKDSPAKLAAKKIIDASGFKATKPSGLAGAVEGDDSADEESDDSSGSSRDLSEEFENAAREGGLPALTKDEIKKLREKAKTVKAKTSQLETDLIDAKNTTASLKTDLETVKSSQQKLLIGGAIAVGVLLVVNVFLGTRSASPAKPVRS